MDFVLDILQKPFTQLQAEQKIVVVLVVLVCALVALGSILRAVRRVKGRRRHWRRRETSPIEVSWQDSMGSRRAEQGCCVDMSAGGLRMELEDPILLGTSVSFLLLQTNLAGTASVRHCTRTGSKYFIGVEFASSH